MMLIYGLIMLLALVIGLLLATLASAAPAVVTDRLKERRKRALAKSSLLAALDPLVSAFAGVARKLPLEGHRARVETLLVLAGNPYGYAPEEYVGLEIASGVLSFLVVLALLFAGTGEFSPLLALFVAIGATLLCWSNLRAKADARRKRMDRQMPFALDLISLTMGAGGTFLQACETVADSADPGPMEEEIEVMLSEVKAGAPLREALKNMTKRSNSEELALMVSSVVQGEELGTPLVQIFETQSTMNRYRRTKAAEQAAAKIPNRLAIPTVFLMLSVLILLFGPIIVKTVRGGMF